MLTLTLAFDYRLRRSEIPAVAFTRREGDKMKLTIEIEIECGSGSIMTFTQAVRRIAAAIAWRGYVKVDAGEIIDVNGNTVGKWEVTSN